MPFYIFLKTAYKYGGLSGKGFLHSFPWIVKTTALEPLRWLELVLHRKKIDTYNIKKDPVFILGYYRSGTTYLQQIFMQDDRLGYTSFYQTIFPELMLTFEKSMTPVLEKITKIFRIQNHFHRIPFSWFFPGEEDVAMMSFMNANSAQWGVLFPGKAIETFTKYTLFEKISNEEQLKWKNNYLYLIKKISIANKYKPLVLKSPLNTARIKQLLSLFPNARFVYISRNPVHVYASTKRLWEMVIKKYILGNPSEINIQQIVIETYSRLMDHYMKDKALIPREQLVEIAYEDFIKHPIHTTKQVYHQLNLGSFEYCKEAMEKHVQKQKNYKTIRHVLEQDELNKVQYQLAPYINYWNKIKENTSHETIIA